MYNNYHPIDASSDPPLSWAVIFITGFHWYFYFKLRYITYGVFDQFKCPVESENRDYRNHRQQNDIPNFILSFKKIYTQNCQYSQSNCQQNT